MRNRDPWNGLRGNALLRSLPPQDALLLGSSLRRVSQMPGDRLVPGETDLVYFPETLIVCLIGQGRDSAVGMVGREGLIGWDRLFRCSDHAQQIFVALTGGSALVVSGNRLRSLMVAHPPLAISLIPFLHSFAEQMGRTVQLTLHGSLEVRLSAWLLMMHERMEGDEIVITHSALAAFLNVRRASVTDTMHVLEGERALRCSRGRVTVHDVAALQARAGLAARGPRQHDRAPLPPGPDKLDARRALERTVGLAALA